MSFNQHIHKYADVSRSLSGHVCLRDNLTWGYCISSKSSYLHRGMRGISQSTQQMKWRMPSSGMLYCVPLVKTYVSEERSASIFRVTIIGELGTTLALTSNRHTLRRNILEALRSSETSVLTRATRRNIAEDGILHSHRRKILKSYIYLNWFSHSNYSGKFKRIYRESFFRKVAYTVYAVP
jgi:hypothetical protein